jgi:hypothetical protein
MDSRDPGARKKREGKLVDYDPNQLYNLLDNRQKDLVEAEAMIVKALAAFKKNRRGDVPISIEDLLQFVLRLFGDINVLYLSNMALIEQFKKGNWNVYSSYGQ